MTDEQVTNFLDNFSLFHMAYSWGEFESLVLMNQPEELNSTHPVGEVDLDSTLVRMHIGLGDTDDLTAGLGAELVRIA